MDLRRLRAGEWVAAVSGVALLVSLFLPWYQIPRADLGDDSYVAYGPLPEGAVNGWESLAANDVLLALVAASGVLLAVVTAAQRVPAVPLALSAFVVLAALLGLVLVLVRLLDLPGQQAGRGAGLWLALVGVVGILVGAAAAMRDERWLEAEPAEIVPMPAPRP
jgi:hypothetical protein